MVVYSARPIKMGEGGSTRRHSGARVGANPESRAAISGFRVCAKRRIPE
jgi:hypothetical protein